MNNIINESDIFKINENFHINHQKIKGTDISVVVVDNFYANPEKVRKFSSELPYTKSKYILKNSPGVRVNLKLDINKIKFLIYDLIGLTNSQIKYKKSSYVIFNRMRSDEKLSLIQTHPHIDSIDKINCAMVVYLNTEDECSGGTSFYRHKKSGLDIVKTSEDLSLIKFKYLKHNKDFITDSNDDWELLELIPMKFNRMVIYPHNLFHSGYIKRDDFLEYDRVVQLGFF